LIDFLSNILKVGAEKLKIVIGITTKIVKLLNRTKVNKAVIILKYCLAINAI